MISAKELFGHPNITEAQQMILESLRKTVDNVYIHAKEPEWAKHLPPNPTRTDIKNLVLKIYRERLQTA